MKIPQILLQDSIEKICLSPSAIGVFQHGILFSSVVGKIVSLRQLPQGYRQRNRSIIRADSVIY